LIYTLDTVVRTVSLLAQKKVVTILIHLVKMKVT